MDSAVAVADKFVREGPIVSVGSEAETGMQPVLKMAHEEGTHPDYPLVILVDSGTASGSEIVAGALGDKLHKRAVLVGERTGGKGSVQAITSYPGGGSQLKYTMAYYYLPSGQRVKSQQAVQEQGRNDWGIGPDLELELRSDEIEKLHDIQRDNSLLTNDADPGWNPHRRSSCRRRSAASRGEA